MAKRKPAKPRGGPKKKNPRRPAATATERKRRSRAKAAAAKARRLATLAKLERGEYLALIGDRWAGVLNRHVEMFGLPIDGPTIDLRELLPQMHAQLARSQGATENEAAQAAVKLARQRIQLRRDELRLEVEAGQWRRVDEVREGLGILAELIRRTADQAQRRFGAEGRGMFEELREDFLAACRRTFGEVAPRPDLCGPVGEERKAPAAAGMNAGAGGGSGSKGLQGSNSDRDRLAVVGDAEVEGSNTVGDGEKGTPAAAEDCQVSGPAIDPQGGVAGDKAETVGGDLLRKG